MSTFESLLNIPKQGIHSIKNNVHVLAIAGLSFTVGIALQNFLSEHSTPQIAQSPRLLVDKLSQERQDRLPYPPDVLPGRRDVDSPYGSIRVYEWGPEDGRKVLMIPGIATPCLGLGNLAHALVNEGCRVMLFDLFGRGYSDSPSGLRQDLGLFASQILMVLASSSLSWTGSSSGGLTLIGYSLGGGIAMSFTASFPHLVNHLVLLAPGGMIRNSQISWKSRLMYSRGVPPRSLMEYLARKRLSTGPSNAALTVEMEKAQSDDTATDSNSSKNPDETGSVNAADKTILFPAYPHITINSAVQFEVDHHPGFVQSFMSSYCHAPIVEQHADWQRVGRRLSAQNQNPGDYILRRAGLDKGKVLIVLSESDTVISMAELMEDAQRNLEGNVVFENIGGGHELPFTHSDDIVQRLIRFWNN